MPGIRLDMFRNINVYLFEPNPLLRKIINSKLKTYRNIKVIVPKLEIDRFEANRTKALNIVVLDRGTLGARFRAELQAVSLGIAGARIAVLDDEMSTVDLSGLIRIGVHGFLSYQHLEKELGPALVRLSKGELWFSTAVLEYYIKTTVGSFQSGDCRGSTMSLTPRQKQVMSMLRKGLSNKEIGTAIGISQSTVKFHMAKIFDKLGVNDRRAILLLPKNRVQVFGLGETEEEPRAAFIGL